MLVDNSDPGAVIISMEKSVMEGPEAMVLRHQCGKIFLRNIFLKNT
jgi:hypothetical protein